jgi:predicted dehydrogenase
MASTLDRLVRSPRPRRRVLVAQGSLDHSTLLHKVPERREARPAPGTGALVIAGAGSIGTRHLENLRRLGRTDVVLYRTGRRPGPDAVVERDLEALLARRPRAMLVCNPTAFHVRMALVAARAGCSLFLEKPVSHSLDGVGELADLVSERGLLTVVGFQYRFHPTLRRVREWIREGAIGEVVSVRAQWGEHLPSWHPGEDYRRSYAARRALGGGVLLTLCHPFDYLRFLLGEVVAVSSEVARRSGLDLDVEDTAHVLLRFASGVLGTVSLDYVQRPRAHGLEVIGTKGRILWSDGEKIVRRQDGESGSVELIAPPAGFTRNTMFLEEMRHFLACLDGREVPSCTLADGVAALQIALAAKRSARERRVVDVAELDIARLDRGEPVFREGVR